MLTPDNNQNENKEEKEVKESQGAANRQYFEKLVLHVNDEDIPILSKIFQQVRIQQTGQTIFNEIYRILSSSKENLMFLVNMQTLFCDIIDKNDSAAFDKELKKISDVYFQEKNPTNPFDMPAAATAATAHEPLNLGDALPKLQTLVTNHLAKTINIRSPAELVIGPLQPNVVESVSMLIISTIKQADDNTEVYKQLAKLDLTEYRKERDRRILQIAICDAFRIISTLMAVAATIPAAPAPHTQESDKLFRPVRPNPELVALGKLKVDLGRLAGAAATLSDIQEINKQLNAIIPSANNIAPPKARLPDSPFGPLNLNDSSPATLNERRRVAEALPTDLKRAVHSNKDEFQKFLQERRLQPVAQLANTPTLHP